MIKLCCLIKWSNALLDINSELKSKSLVTSGFKFPPCLVDPQEQVSLTVGKCP